VLTCMRTHAHRRGLRYHTGRNSDRSGVTLTLQFQTKPFLVSLVGAVVSNSLSGIISARIKVAREARGISASQLSRSVGVTPAAVWYWEKRGVSPGNPSLEQIAKALGVSVGFLRGGNEEATERELASHPLVVSILEEARARIAKATNLDLEGVKLSVQLASKGDVERH
jgi:transcriptional regulator with XRE-family HTH domain